MLSVFDIANWFLNHESMNHRKLQKLCYYAQAWYVALYDGTPLFKEQFKAWKIGPVCVELYAKYRIYRYDDIPQNTDRAVIFDEKTETILNVVYDSYKNYTSDELIKLTQNERPWIYARGSLAKNEYCNAVIQLPLMRDFYFEVFKKGQND